CELSPDAALHHTRAIHDGRTVGVHVASTRRDGMLQGVWCAVDPAWRRRGLAQRLVARHVRWAGQHDRLRIRAHTPADCAAMLVANLKAGLSVVGSFTDADGAVFVIFQGTAP
ncbi:MAG: GNAT family N-acetyltransferase, partial [Myxococcota bacterium]